MDLKESMWDFAKVFCEGLHVQLAAKLFCLENFMVYDIFNCIYSSKVSLYHTFNEVAV